MGVSEDGVPDIVTKEGGRSIIGVAQDGVNFIRDLKHSLFLNGYWIVTEKLHLAMSRVDSVSHEDNQALVKHNGQHKKLEEGDYFRNKENDLNLLGLVVISI